MGTKGRLLTVAAAVCVLLLPWTCCRGADPIPERVLEMGYSINGGAAFLTGNYREEVTYLLGADWYGPGDGRLNENAALGLSGDWMRIRTKDNRWTDLVPVLVNFRQYWNWGDTRIFITIGAGLNVAIEGIPEIGFIGGANFGWTGGLGLALSNNLYVQARFIGGKDPSRDGLIAAHIGYRF